MFKKLHRISSIYLLYKCYSHNMKINGIWLFWIASFCCCIKTVFHWYWYWLRFGIMTTLVSSQQLNFLLWTLVFIAVSLLKMWSGTRKVITPRDRMRKKKFEVVASTLAIAAFGPAYLMSDEISSSVVTLCSWHCSTGEQISRCAPNSSLSSSLTARSSSPAEVWDERLLPRPSCWKHYCLPLNLERVRDAELVFCGTPIHFQLQWNGFSSTFSF